jgi:hypothetical protein
MDTYVSSAAMRNVRVSLHASGQWHVKVNSGSVKSPPVAISNAADTPPQTYQIGLRILIPDRSLRPAKNPDSTSVPDKWLERPPYGGVSELAFMTWKCAGYQEEWPGASIGTELLYAMKIQSDVLHLILLRQLSADSSLAKLINEFDLAIVKQVQKDGSAAKNGRGVQVRVPKDGGLILQEYSLDQRPQRF